MKICILAPEFIPVWGGVGTYIVELVKHLPKDIEIHVVTLMREGFNREKVSTSDFDLPSYLGRDVHVHFICRARDTFFYNGLFQYSCLKFVPKIVKKEKIEIIHSHTAHMPDLLLQSYNDVPTVTTIHTTIRGQRNGTRNSGLGFSSLELSEKFTYLGYPFLRFAESVYFLKKRYYITVSNWMKDQIFRHYPRVKLSPISVIHNSVDTKQFSPRTRNHSKRDIVLFTGRLIAAKGINFLVEAIPKILRAFPNAFFLFVGAGNSLPFQKRLKKMGVPKNSFTFSGYIKETRELIEYYRNATVYVAPTLYENLPIRVLEAMACGIPVVASNICAIPEAISNGFNGILIKPGSVNELVDSLHCLLGDSALRRKLGENARKTVLEKFNIDVNAIRTAKVYSQIIGS